jgi:hypothetical protein
MVERTQHTGTCRFLASCASPASNSAGVCPCQVAAGGGTASLLMTCWNRHLSTSHAHAAQLLPSLAITMCNNTDTTPARLLAFLAVHVSVTECSHEPVLDVHAHSPMYEAGATPAGCMERG